MGSMSPIHWLIVLGVALLLFGGNRVAGLGKGLGEGIRNFKKGLSGDGESQEKDASASAAQADSPKQLQEPPKKADG